MPGRFCVSITHAKDNTDKATVAFLVANAAVGSDKETVVFLSIEGVWLAVDGYADDINEPGLAPLKQLIGDFTANGGKIWLCTPCVKKRNLEDAKLVPGAEIVGGATAIEFLSSGTTTLSY